MQISIYVYKIGDFDIGGFLVIAKIIRKLKSHMIPYKFKYSVVSIKRTGCNKRTGWSKKFF